MSTYCLHHPLCQQQVIGKKIKALIIAHFATLVPGKCSIFGLAAFLRAKNDLKKKILMYVWLLPVMFFLISHRVTAQDSTARSYNDNNQVVLVQLGFFI